MTDINPHHILYSKTPAAWHPYLLLARVDRPTGVWLLLLPCLWAFAAAPVSWEEKIWLSAVFFLGAFIMRSAGCVVNDLWDRRLDRAVARTRTRPLAAGTLTPRQAIIFLAGLLLSGLLILLTLPATAILLGVLALPLVAVYPLMKRITWWPQAFLGITFNWGVLLGWAGTGQSLSWPVFVLYAGGILWTLAYDTIYAHQDKEDDARIGIKSTALRFGSRSKDWVRGFLIGSTACFVIAKIGFSTEAPSAISGVLFLAMGAHALWQMRRWQPDDAGSSLMIFRSNAVFGLLVAAFFGAP